MEVVHRHAELALAWTESRSVHSKNSKTQGVSGEDYRGERIVGAREGLIKYLKCIPCTAGTNPSCHSQRGWVRGLEGEPAVVIRLVFL